jgi:hypothetical protein
MEAVGGGIEADVKRDRGRAGREEPFEFVAIGHVGDQPAPLQIVKYGRGGSHGKRLFKG